MCIFGTTAWQRPGKVGNQDLLADAPIPAQNDVQPEVLNTPGRVEGTSDTVVWPSAGAVDGSPSQRTHTPLPSPPRPTASTSAGIPGFIRRGLRAKAPQMLVSADIASFHLLAALTGPRARPRALLPSATPRTRSPSRPPQRQKAKASKRQGGEHAIVTVRAVVLVAYCAKLPRLPPSAPEEPAHGGRDATRPPADAPLLARLRHPSCTSSASPPPSPPSPPSFPPPHLMGAAERNRRTNPPRNPRHVKEL
ncbi:hypothetical protein DFH09DRAFT_1314810 [Mycena vulgaris]|nr:hypothetical protein DFH09DRAFT_1314810 [Mycena vulgaris]